MPSEKWLARPAVLQSLLEGAAVRLCVIKAAPGYGKTVALRQLGDHLGERAAYLSLTEQHGDPATLEGELVRLAGSLEDAAESAVERVILLDNYDAIAEFPLANEVLERAIMTMPEHHHIVLATRRRPLLPLGQLRGSRSLVELGEAELSFSESELDRVIREVWQLPGSINAHRLSPLTEGWITGAALLAHPLGAGTQRLDDAAWNTFDYFAEIIGHRMSPAALRFATTCSILTELHPEICERLTGEGAPLATLRSLSENSLFTQSTAAAGTRFRFHPLFRAFLQDRLAQERSPAEIDALHLQAATALTEGGDSTAALAHFLHAGHPEQAATLLKEIGIGQLKVGSLSEVEILLNQLPGSTMRSLPWLLALLGRLKRLRNEFDGAFAALGLAEKEFTAQDDSDGLAWVSSEMNQVRYRDEAYDGSAITIKNNLDSPSITPLTYANLAAHLCWMQCETGPVSEAIKAGENALSRGTLIDDAFLRNRALMRAHRNLALAAVYSGDLDRAFALVDHARNTEGADGFELAWADIIYSIALVLRGELEAAHGILVPLIETRAPYSSTQHHWAQWWLGNLLRAQGRLSDAHAAYRAAGNLAAIDQAIIHPPEAGSVAATPSHSALRQAGIGVVQGLRHLDGDPAQALGVFAATEELLRSSGHLLHSTSLAAFRSRALARLGRHREVEEARATAVGFMMHNRIEILPWGVSLQGGRDLEFATGQPRQTQSFPSLVEGCPDPEIRERLAIAHREGSLSPDILGVLREQGLTWRETDIFTVYYLRAGLTLIEGSSRRERTAKTLGISEHTLKSHITRIRSKLDLPEAREAVADWLKALETHPATPTPEGPALQRG